MFRKLLLLPILSLFFATGAFAEPGDWQNFAPNRQYFVSIDTFRGDQHGEFKNDLVACLSDDSAWKVHPTDKDKFSRWTANDIVHVGVRNSFYWFKREHKFELVNHTRNETVKVMMVQYPRVAPLTVVLAETYLKNQSIQPFTYTDSLGRINTIYVPSNTYEKKVALSDGSVWTIRKNFESFSIGNRVYVGVNATKNGFDFLLISGLEREAEWTWAKKLN